MPLPATSHHNHHHKLSVTAKTRLNYKTCAHNSLANRKAQSTQAKIKTRRDNTHTYEYTKHTYTTSTQHSASHHHLFQAVGYKPQAPTRIHLLPKRSKASAHPASQIGRPICTSMSYSYVQVCMIIYLFKAYGGGRRRQGPREGEAHDELLLLNPGLRLLPNTGGLLGQRCVS